MTQFQRSKEKGCKMAKRIITFSGKQYSGKDTAAKILMEALPDFKRCAMGDIIKIEYGRLNGLTYEEIEAFEGLSYLELHSYSVSESAFEPGPVTPDL